MPGHFPIKAIYYKPSYTYNSSFWVANPQNSLHLYKKETILYNANMLVTDAKYHRIVNYISQI